MMRQPKAPHTPPSGPYHELLCQVQAKYGKPDPPSQARADVRAAAQKYGSLLISKKTTDRAKLKNDEKFMGLIEEKSFLLGLVQQYGAAFYFAPDALREDKEFVLAAVMRNGKALEFASHELRKDREVALLAVLQDEFAYEFVDITLQADYEVRKFACYKAGEILIGDSRLLPVSEPKFDPKEDAATPLMGCGANYNGAL